MWGFAGVGGDFRIPNVIFSKRKRGGVKRGRGKGNIKIICLF
jgi:hypothetical protein